MGIAGVSLFDASLQELIGRLREIADEQGKSVEQLILEDSGQESGWSLLAVPPKRYPTPAEYADAKKVLKQNTVSDAHLAQVKRYLDSGEAL